MGTKTHAQVKIVQGELSRKVIQTENAVRYKRWWYSGGGEKSAKASWESSCWDSSGQAGVRATGWEATQKEQKRSWAGARFRQYLNSSAWPGSCLRCILILAYSTNVSSPTCLEHFTLHNISPSICLANL